MAMKLPKGSIFKFDDQFLSEHNRGEVSVEPIRIENSNRMSDGTLRRVVIADKKKWDVSWDELPDVKTKTVDGYMGGKDLKEFYESTPGVFILTIVESGVSKVYNVAITSFSHTILKRGPSAELWNVSLSLEEA